MFSCLAAINDQINDALVPLHDSSAVQCTICSKVLSTMGNGRLHVEDMHFPRAVVCLICNDTIPSLKKFRNHISGTHKKVGERNVVKKYGQFVVKIEKPKKNAELPKMRTDPSEEDFINPDDGALASPSKIVWG